MRRFNFCFGFLSIFCVLATFSPPAWGEPEIKIGVSTPTKFEIGPLQWNPTVLAAEEINNAGGVTVGDTKYKIKLFKENSNELMSVVDAVNAVERLITVKGVDFITGTIRSEAALAQLEVAADHKKIFMNTGAATPMLSLKVAKNYDRYKYWFRGGSMNAIYMGKYIFGWIEQPGRIIREQFGIKTPKVAIIAEKALWADPIVKALKANLPKLNFAVGPIFRVSAMAMDLSSELSAVKRSESQIIVFFGTGPVDTTVSRQVGELKLPVVILGPSTIPSTQGHWKATEGLCNYRVIGTYISDSEITEKTRPFWHSYIKKFGEFPIGVASGAYDTVYAIKGAVERAGTLDSDAVVVEMEKTDFIGVQGRYRFNPVGSKFPHDKIYGPHDYKVTAVQWQDGKLVSVWPDGHGISMEKGWEGIRYKGTKDFKLPPWMVKYWKDKK